jgi:ABC-type branched-subunit amino acid transport system substrate-binding protein
LKDIRNSSPDVVVMLTDWLTQLRFAARYEAEGIEIPITGFPEASTQTRDYYSRLVQAAPRTGAGHRASLWEPTLDAYGARELNARFAARWGRPMDAVAWSGYQAVKIAFDAAQFCGATNGVALAQFLAQSTSVFDVHKGIGVSFRPWDHQLRQSLYLVRLNHRMQTHQDLESLRKRAHLVGELPAIYMPGTDPTERLDQLGNLTSKQECSR